MRFLGSGAQVTTGVCCVVAGVAMILGRDAAAADGATPADSVATMVQKAEAARQAGRLTEAAELFGRARAASPGDITAMRGVCKTSLALRRPAEARDACKRVNMLSNSTEAMRDIVAALVDVVDVAPLDDLSLASMMTDGILARAPGEVWGYAARCDLARRLAAPEMLATCLADLQRWAPGHPETKRALALAQAAGPTWKWWLRALIPAVPLATLVHAMFWRRRRRRERAQSQKRRIPDDADSRGRSGDGDVGTVDPGPGPGGKQIVHPSALVLLLLALPVAAMAFPRAAHAEPRPGTDMLSSIPIDDQHPERSVPPVEEQNKNPLEFGYLLQDLIYKAENVKKAGDHAAAARFFYALSVAAPKRAYAFRRLCEERALSGDRAGAIQACRSALDREGVEAKDFQRYVEKVLEKPGPLKPSEKKELEAVLKHLEGQPGTEFGSANLRCQAALHEHDVRALESCSARMAKVAANDPATISFQWALAVEKRDQKTALQVIELGRKNGMPKEGLEMMTARTATMARQTMIRIALWSAAGAAIVGLFVFFRFRKGALART